MMPEGDADREEWGLIADWTSFCGYSFTDICRYLEPFYDDSNVSSNAKKRQLFRKLVWEFDNKASKKMMLDKLAAALKIYDELQTSLCEAFGYLPNDFNELRLVLLHQMGLYTLRGFLDVFDKKVIRKVNDFKYDPLKFPADEYCAALREFLNAKGVAEEKELLARLSDIGIDRRKRRSKVHSDDDNALKKQKIFALIVNSMDCDEILVEFQSFIAVETAMLGRPSLKVEYNYKLDDEEVETEAEVEVEASLSSPMRKQSSVTSSARKDSQGSASRSSRRSEAVAMEQGAQLRSSKKRARVQDPLTSAIEAADQLLASEPDSEFQRTRIGRGEKDGVLAKSVNGANRAAGGLSGSRPSAHQIQFTEEEGMDENDPDPKRLSTSKPSAKFTPTTLSQLFDLPFMSDDDAGLLAGEGRRGDGCARSDNRGLDGEDENDPIEQFGEEEKRDRGRATEDYDFDEPSLVSAKSRVSRRFWTFEEEELFIEAQRKHGRSWATILKDPAFKMLSEWTNVNLKDKYRNLLRVGRIVEE